MFQFHRVLYIKATISRQCIKQGKTASLGTNNPQLKYI